MEIGNNTPNIFLRNEIRQQEGGAWEHHPVGVQQVDGRAGGQEEAGHGVPRKEVRYAYLVFSDPGDILNNLMIICQRRGELAAGDWRQSQRGESEETQV